MSLKDIVGELRHETMRRFKKDLFSFVAAERFKIQDYDSVITAAREARLLAPDDLSITELFAWAMCYAGEPEAAGAAIMQRKPVAEVGVNLVQCSESLSLLAQSVEALAPTCKEAQESSQRMTFAADRMKLAGTELQGTTEKPKGKKAWLKG